MCNITSSKFSRKWGENKWSYTTSFQSLLMRKRCSQSSCLIYPVLIIFSTDALTLTHLSDHKSIWVFKNSWQLAFVLGILKERERGIKVHENAIGTHPMKCPSIVTLMAFSLNFPLKCLPRRLTSHPHILLLKTFLQHN